MVTKRSLMLGLGETDDEVLQAMKDIKHSISVNQSIYNSSNSHTFSVVDLFTPNTTLVLLLFLLF